MSNNQEPLKVNVDDLRDVLEFWAMKDDLLFYIKSFQSDCELYQGTEGLVSDIEKLINRIESLGKKEGE